MRRKLVPAGFLIFEKSCFFILKIINQILKEGSNKPFFFYSLNTIIVTEHLEALITIFLIPFRPLKAVSVILASASILFFLQKGNKKKIVISTFPVLFPSSNLAKKLAIAEKIAVK